MNNNEYETQANDFLTKTKTTLNFKSIGLHKPRNWESEPVNTYLVTLKNEKHKYTFEFYDSINATYTTHTTPTNYSVLACLSVFDCETLKEFAETYGYDITTEEEEEKTQTIFKAVCEQDENLKLLFDTDELSLLSEVA
jgi:hypothetical protein